MWRPPEGESSEVWRRLNREADAEATRQLEELLSEAAYMGACTARREADSWARTFLSHLNFATREYRSLILDREERGIGDDDVVAAAVRRRPSYYRLE